MVFNIILFNNFETLDVFGPVEVFGKVEDREIKYYSLEGGLISNQDNVYIRTEALDQITGGGILFIPGGLGIREEVNNTLFIDKIRYLANQSQYVLTVCTGSALLAKTGLLNGKEATSNKRSFDWVKTTSDNVNWRKQARWVVDGKYYTSSGISAGIDMALGFISDLRGTEEARRIAHRIEYSWQEDKGTDNFAG